VIYSTNVAFGDLIDTKLFYIITGENVNYDTFNQATLGAIDSLVGLSLSVAALIATTLLW
jgi:hypothetical protein